MVSINFQPGSSQDIKDGAGLLGSVSEIAVVNTILTTLIPLPWTCTLRPSPEKPVCAIQSVPGGLYQKRAILTFIFFSKPSSQKCENPRRITPL